LSDSILYKLVLIYSILKNSYKLKKTGHIIVDPVTCNCNCHF